MDVESDQYQRLETGWGLLNLGNSEEIFSLHGEGFVDFLNNYNTQDIQKMTDDQVALGAFLTQKGKLISDAVILKLPDRFLLVWKKGYGEKILQHLAIYLNFAEVEFQEVTKDYFHWAVLGKNQPSGILKSLPPPDLKYSFQTLTFQNTPLFAFTTDRLGFPAWEILGPSTMEKEFLNTLQASGGFILSEECAETLRIESGLPKMGVDMDDHNLVAEVGLDRRATSFQKGCYLGQETTARVESQGHINKKLHLLRLEKTLSGPLPLDILKDGQKVGEISSTTYSPRYSGPIALGILQTIALASPGDLTVQDGDHRIGVKALEP